MKNKAFTLIELLVVVAIMGLLGTASVGGYRQMQRGMEERGVIDNASKFVALASERAQIDRKMTAVYFWNEMLRDETENANKIVVGRAVAVRFKGRISGKSGDCLLDEFGDLEQFDESGEFKAARNGELVTKRLYLFDCKGGTPELKFSTVRDTPQTRRGSVDGDPEIFLSSNPAEDNNDSYDYKGEIVRYGYYLESASGDTAHSSDWGVGSVYGLEFQSIELPHNYIFGSTVPKNMKDPVSVKTLMFDAEQSSSSGSSVGGSAMVEISCLRPGQGGALAPQSIGNTKRPDGNLN